MTVAPGTRIAWRHPFRVQDLGAKGYRPMDDKSIQAASEAIRRYLSTHPRAADAIEGIHSYWIEWDDVPEKIAVTEAALLQLEQAGFVERTKVANRDVWRRRDHARGIAKA